MTTAVDHASRRFGASRVALVAVLASLGLLLGWAAPAGAHAAAARPAPSTASGSNVGHAPATAVRAARSALVGVAVRSANYGVAAQRTVRGAVGSQHSLPLVALLVTAFGVAAVLGRGVLLAQVVVAGPRVGHATGRRDRAPPVLAPTAA